MNTNLIGGYTYKKILTAILVAITLFTGGNVLAAEYIDKSHSVQQSHETIQEAIEKYLINIQ